MAHLPWDHVRLDLTAARDITRGQERAWLEEFTDYLRKAIRMRDPADSWTYCVAISNDRPGGGPRTFREFVTIDGCYFHPYGLGKGWPRTPPNFLAFRWDGQVQQVRRVTRAEVIPDLPRRSAVRGSMLMTAMATGSLRCLELAQPGRCDSQAGCGDGSSVNGPPRRRTRRRCKWRAGPGWFRRPF